MMADVRLIDADALEGEAICLYSYGGARYIPLWALNKAPTIDPESMWPVGEWKPYYDYFTNRKVGWICTNCSGVQDDLSNGDTNYCPHCGARMKGESK